MRTPTKVGITMDCADADELAVFWARFLGYARRPGPSAGPYVTIDRPDGVDGPPNITFQEVPEPKVSKNRMHLDLFVDHAAPLVRDMITNGATELTTADAGEWTTRVLQDPAGNEFCVIGPD